MLCRLCGERMRSDTREDIIRDQDGQRIVRDKGYTCPACGYWQIKRLRRKRIPGKHGSNNAHTRIKQSWTP